MALMMLELASIRQKWPQRGVDVAVPRTELQ
jgi:hypothetical protein